MTTNWNYRQHDALRQHARNVIAQAESRGNSTAVSVVPQGSSGVAAGRYQVDLGKHPDLARDIVAMAQRSGAFVDPKTGKDDPEKAQRMTRLLTQEYGESIRDDRNPTLKAESDEAQTWMAQMIQRSDVQALVDRKGEALIDANIARLQNVCGRAAPQAQAFCNSLQGQVEMVSFMHQSGAGHNQAIRDFVEGNTATIGRGSGAPQVRLEGNADVRQFREKIRDNTPFGRNPFNRSGLDGRDREMDSYYYERRIDDAVPVLMNPPPAERFRGEGERAEGPSQAPTQTADADDKIKNRVLGIEPAPGGGYRPVWGTDEEYEAVQAREAEQAHTSLADEAAKEQTTNVAQPAAHRTQWHPDLAKIDEAIASLGADDLPSWTKTLLGRDVLANGAKPAVMGFQRAINDATRPPGFDVRWNFDKRHGRIDVDGDLGPQTRAGFGRAIEKQGEDGFKKLYAVDQFGRYVKNVDRGRAKLDDLEDTIAGTLGQAKDDAAERAQETLNMFAEDRDEPGVPLKIDGWIGPKTTATFGALLRKTSPEALTERFAGKDFWADEDLA